MRSKHVTPVPTARVNVDKVTVEEAIELLASEGIEAKVVTYQMMQFRLKEEM